ncbi:MAG: NmrA family NAD(P)-binding protein, partial [Rhodospirillaceae bacterium]|nr:NmrA family NAD(P)-binding protein [Rhodospirillaceae bacterium]
GAVVTAFVRDASQEDEMKALGASQIAVGDMDDPATIRPALEGCDAIVHIGPPMHPDEKTMTSHFVSAAKEARLSKFIYYSVMHPLRRDVRHHSLKLDTEEMLIESGMPYSIVQPMRYMQHLEPIWKRVMNDGVHAMPFNTQVKFNVVDLLDLAEATARITLEDGWLYGTYELAGPISLSQTDMADIIGNVIGKTVSAEQVPIAAMQEKARAGGASDDRIKQMTIMNEHYDAFGFLGNSRILELVLRRKANTFEEYVRRLSTQG